MDSHHTQRYLDAKGHVRNEGDVEIGGFPPYPIDYGSLTPRADECDNLLVPVCLSASHIAFGSIRMEPVFMVLGQSSATAAMLAVRDNIAVQQVDYDQLRQKLLEDNQVLTWTRPSRPAGKALNAASLPGIIVDDDEANRVGFDAASAVAGPFIEQGYRHDGDAKKGEQLAVFTTNLPQAGRYEVRIAWSPNPNRATNTPVTVRHAKGMEIVKINQQLPPKHSPFGTVGKFSFAAGKAEVSIRNDNTDGHVIVDAVQWILLP